MKKVAIYLPLLIVVLFTSCKKDEDTTQASELDDLMENALTLASNGQGIDHFKLPKSDDLSAIPQDPKNPLTQEKVSLGQLLYHETGLALAPKMDISKQTYSCASCHFAAAGFQAGRFQGIADGGIGFGVNGEGRVKSVMYHGDSIDVQPIRTPTAMNTAYQKVMLWNGQFGATGPNVGTEANWPAGTPIATNELGYEGLEVQAIAGLKVHRLVIDKEFLDETGYTARFDAAFPNIDTAERYTREYAGLAIAAYERTLLSNEAPFQRWLNGEKNALTDQEKRGALVFFEKANCASCHNGPALSSMEFYALGMEDLYSCPETVFQSNAASGANKGRGGFTKQDEDLFKFKVPQLYNLSDSPFYGHGSSMRSIKEVIDYKNEAKSENSSVPESQLADEFVPQLLTADEVDDITAFLANGLRDPQLARYQPASLLSGLCTPFNDPMSKSELGCN